MFGHSNAFSSRVKPAAFDLFLGGCIAAYLAIVYYTIQVRKCTLFTLSIHTVLHSTLHFFLCFEHLTLPVCSLTASVCSLLQNFDYLYIKLKAAAKYKHE